MSLTLHGRPTVMSQEQRAGLALMHEIDQTPPQGRRPKHVLLSTLVLMLTLAVVASACDGVWTYQRWHASLDPKVSTPLRVVDASDAAAYQAFAGNASGAGAAPIVLTYHDISPTNPNTYVVTPTAFAAQMEMIHEAGYQTLTAAQFVAYKQGRFTPSGRSVLITFDDGTAGLWKYGDRVLQTYGFHAVSFVISGQVGTHRPYYLTWNEMRRMRDTGRWDFESHTHNEHSRVVTGPDGRVGGLLSNRIYSGGRYETWLHFEKRVRADLQHSATDLTSRGFPAPTLFAYPFSDVVEDGSNTADTRAVSSVLNGLFVASFVDANQGTSPVSRREAEGRLLERLEVKAADTDRSLFDAMVAMDSLPVSSMRPLNVDQTWLDDADASAAVVSGGRVTFASADKRYVSADWAPQRTADWVDYTVSATITGLRGTVSGGLRVRSGSTAAVTLRISAQDAQVVTRAGAVVAELPLTTRGTHRVSATVTRTRTVFSVDGVHVGSVAASVTSGPASGTATTYGGFGLTANRPDPATTYPTFSALRVTPA